MIWSVYFGSAAAVARGAHLRIDMLINAVRPGVRRALDIVATTWVLAFGLAMTWAGYLYVKDSFTLGFVSADSNLSLQIGWIQLVIPLTFALSAFHAARRDLASGGRGLRQGNGALGRRRPPRSLRSLPPEGAQSVPFGRPGGCSTWPLPYCC